MPVRRVAPAALAAAALLLAASGPAAGFGEPPLPATEISQHVTLQEAAAAGMVTLSAKGGIAGDQVRVDLRHRYVQKPVRITLRIDFTGFAQPGVARPGIATAVRNGVRELNRRVTRGPGLPRVEFDVEYTVSGRGAPRPAGSHQVRIIPAAADYRSQLEENGRPNDVDGVDGTWTISDVLDPVTFAHEALHLAGLPDRYITIYTEPGTGRQYRAPTDLVDTAAVNAWARAHVPPLRPGGMYRPVPQAPCDIMAALGSCARIRPADVRRLAAQAGTRLQAAAGDVLANKSGAHQDFGVAQPLNLFAPRGGTARVDGLVVYCIDLEAATPTQGQVFDAAGPAAALGGEGNARLQRLLEHIATLPAPAGGRQDLRPGALFAVWAVTNPTETEPEVITPEVVAVLQGAGLSTGGPGTPDTPNPNAANPATGAVTPDGTVAPDPGPAPVQPVLRTSVESLVLSQTTLRARRATRVRLIVRASGGEATVRIAVQRRRGARWTTVGAFPPRRVAAGGATFGLRLPALPPGSYRVRATGAGTAATPFTVR